MLAIDFFSCDVAHVAAQGFDLTETYKLFDSLCYCRVGDVLYSVDHIQHMLTIFGTFCF